MRRLPSTVEVERDSQPRKHGADACLKHLGPGLFSVAMILIVVGIVAIPFHPVSHNYTDNVTRPKPTPTIGNNGNGALSTKGKNGNLTGTPVPTTVLSGTVNWDYTPVPKNGSYVVTFTSTEGTYADSLVYTPSPYPNNSNFWWAYSVIVPSNFTYYVAVGNGTYTWIPAQDIVTPLGTTFHFDFYCE